MFFFLMVSFD